MVADEVTVEEPVADEGVAKEAEADSSTTAAGSSTTLPKEAAEGSTAARQAEAASAAEEDVQEVVSAMEVQLARRGRVAQAVVETNPTSNASIAEYTGTFSRSVTSNAATMNRRLISPVHMTRSQP